MSFIKKKWSHFIIFILIKADMINLSSILYKKIRRVNNDNFNYV